jgi:hypothetical protein
MAQGLFNYATNFGNSKKSVELRAFMSDQRWETVLSTA